MISAETEANPPAKGKVLTHCNTATGDNPMQAQELGRNKLRWSFIICVIVPLIVASAYYATIATDRYTASAGFSIRGIDTSAGMDSITALTGLASSGSTTSDSYIVLNYLAGRELVEALDKELDLRGAYAATEVDSLSRLGVDANVEALLSYWHKRILTQFDPTSGIIEFEVQSFSPEHARDIADAVLRLTQAFVNDLSSSARRDALRFAREEVELQGVRLRDARVAIQSFRASQQSVDPSASAALEIELIARLESRLIDLNARTSALRQTLDEDAPSLNALRRNAEALEAQIVERRHAIGHYVLDDAGNIAATQKLTLYEELEGNRSLAQQAYESALVSLEQARRDADRQQRYLAIHLRPQIAQSAKYPSSLQNLVVLSFALFTAWGIGALLAYSIRDHLT